MKRKRKTQSYMWAHYYSEDGNWRAWDDDVTVKGGGKKQYNPETKRFERGNSIRHVWYLENLKNCLQA